MRSAFLCLAASWILAGIAAQAWAAPAASDGSATPAVGQGSDASANACENPRYRYCDGRWWYWMPERYWVYYDGGQWHKPAASVDTATGGEGPIQYTTGYRGPVEASGPPYDSARRSSWSRSAGSPMSDVNFGTHGNAISFGF